MGEIEKVSKHTEKPRIVIPSVSELKTGEINQTEFKRNYDFVFTNDKPQFRIVPCDNEETNDTVKKTISKIKKLYGF
jgi:siroheme synthase (precorrin-2 oxidase/ferrochelatase)